ncbi:MAG TPA: DUF2087 domain-containing protein [Rubrivivax sp.]
MNVADPLALLSALVVKTGVALGGLSESERAQVLALAAGCLAEDGPASEAAVNRLLKNALENELAFLGTDHVELRRWLVDAGWWQRDGFGHEYRRVPVGMLPLPMQERALLLRGLDAAAWVQARRDEVATRRAARHAEWQARQNVGGLS